ncbi:hypothetical protein D3C87_1944230 [compost metagenome]
MFCAYQFAPLRLGKGTADRQGHGPTICLRIKFANVTGGLAGLRHKAKGGCECLLFHQQAKLW